MICYKKPGILTLSQQDVVELFGPAETQYTFVVAATTPLDDGVLRDGKDIFIQLNGSLNVSTVSAEDILIEKTGTLTAEGTVETADAGIAAMSWDVSVVTTDLPDDTIVVDPHLRPGKYTLTVPATGQDIQSIDGLHLQQFMFDFKKKAVGDQKCEGAGPCNNQPPCGPKGTDCLCNTTVEGDPFCYADDFCKNRPTCQSTKDCPNGQVCISTTCCQSNGQVESDGYKGLCWSHCSSKEVNMSSEAKPGRQEQKLHDLPTGGPPR